MERSVKSELCRLCPMEAGGSLLKTRRIVLSVSSDKQGAVLKFTCSMSVLKYQMYRSSSFLRVWIFFSAQLQSGTKRGAVIAGAGKKASFFLASGLCTFVYILVFFFCRVKLKHFEKFQDTTEALAGKGKLALFCEKWQKPTKQQQSLTRQTVVHSLLTSVSAVFILLGF